MPRVALVISCLQVGLAASCRGGGPPFFDDLRPAAGPRIRSFASTSLVTSMILIAVSPVTVGLSVLVA